MGARQNQVASCLDKVGTDGDTEWCDEDMAMFISEYIKARMIIKLPTMSLVLGFGTWL